MAVVNNGVIDLGQCGSQVVNVPYCSVSNDFSKGLIVFFPPARPERRSHIKPYLPRISWHQDILGCDALYLGDPFVDDDWNLSNGSWWLDKNGYTILASLAKHLLSLNKERILIYGSSMGGYAALVLSSLMNVDCIAECPQIDLFKFPGSQKFLRGIGFTADKRLPEHNIFSFWRERGLPEGRVKIILNIGDSLHISQLNDEILDKRNADFIRSFKTGFFDVNFYSSSESYGHSVLPKEKAIENIDKWVRAVNE